MGLFLSCSGTLGVPLEWIRLCCGISSVGSKVSMTLLRLKWDVEFLSRCPSGKGPHRALRGESPGFSQVAAANLGFLSNYDWELRDTFVGPQEIPVSILAARGFSGFLCSRCWGRGPYLDLKLESQGSSPVPTWISGFLWSFQRGVRPLLMWRHASPLYSRAGKAVSGFLSS